ncbi:hypothetical protein Tco_1069000 [Tanacetum coccineum]|uniref:Uncharacterized protein n=1 Tax=Tanacetum coccineum TaxID=301880 RepID=A0ABQ5HH82_9ASTR
MLSPQGAVRLWKNLRFLLFLHPMFQNLKKNPNKTRRRQRKKCKSIIWEENTAHVPSPGEEDSIFMEIPKPKAKKTVNLDPNPNSYPSKLPYPERMKVREHDKPSAQYSRFLKMFKQLRLEIGLKDALVEMPKFYLMVKLVAKTTRELEEIAITAVNAEFRYHHETKFPRNSKIRGKFLVSQCALQGTQKGLVALADSGA